MLPAMLNDTKVRTLKPQEKSYRLLDAERLYIEVRPTGKKIWRFKYTLHGKEGTISFGEYPAVSLVQARKLKDEAKAKLAIGLNPSEEKKKERQIILVTHNPNIVVGADAENVIVANQHSEDSPNTHGIQFDYTNGSLENTYTKNVKYTLEKQGIREHVVEILEGGKEAFEKREKKYK